MKSTTKKLFALFLAIIAIFSFASCGKEEIPDSSLWENALYTEDTDFVQGEKHLGMLITAEDKTIVFNIYSDAETVGEALMENKLVEGTNWLKVQKDSSDFISAT